MMGHFGRRPMASRIIRSGKFWPTLHDDIRREIEHCAECQRTEVRKSGFHPARTIDALLPGDHYQIDLATMTQSEAGHKYMFVLVDVFSGFVVLRPLKKIGCVDSACYGRCVQSSVFLAYCRVTTARWHCACACVSSRHSASHYCCLQPSL